MRSTKRSLRTRLGAVIALGSGLALAAAVAVPAGAATAQPGTDPVPVEGDATWTPLGDLGTGDALVQPDSFEPYRLDIDAFGALLPSPLARSAASDVISLPDPNGVLVRFAVRPVEVLEPAIAAAHPEIAAFTGRGVDDPTLSVRADLSPLGLHASVRSSDRSSHPWYIDPAFRGDVGRYVSYPGGAIASTREFPEGTDEATEFDGAEEGAPAEGEAAESTSGGGPVTGRTIRLAIASDPSFASFYGTDQVLAAKVSIVNRMAGIYNDDLGVHLVLVNASDQLNFDTLAKAETAGYSASGLATCSVESLQQNSTAVQNIVGTENYDIGHLVLGNQGGGLAGYAEVGLDYVKGGGCTGDPNPVGDGFAVDYVAHEIGHQVGGSHTYNACGGSSGDTAVEPGSGTTIMAYAGICGDNNLQPHSDPYFSQTSIVEIQRTLARLPAVPTSNTAPVVTAPDAKTIPMRTPFTLTASGSDPDADPVTYTWEQNDAGDPDRQLFDDGKTGGPLFRVFGTYADIDSTETKQYFSPGENLAGADPSRTFPDLAQILAGTTNAESGVCDPALSGIPKVDCYSEFLPTAAYKGDSTGSLNFRVTARDQNPAGGGVSQADVRLTLAQDAGPFLITSQGDRSEPVAGGSALPVTWEVNGTDRAELAPTVRILFSENGGASFDQVLTAGTANDGSETVTVPNIATENGRIKIEAVGNYFFDISDAPIVVTRGAAPSVDRISGADRFEVSANTSKQGFPDGATTVFVASGEVFPDALSAAPAAAAANAPILLSNRGSLPAAVRSELQRLHPDRIVIVGGTLTITSAVEDDLRSLAGRVDRIGGADRFEASRNIALAAFPDGADSAVLATGRSFPDALSAGAAVKGTAPVVLVDGTAPGLDAPTTDLLRALGVSQIVIVGGEASVSSGLQADAAAVADTIRLGGADRFAASRSINDHYFPRAARVLLATGQNFPDALSGSAFAPTVDAPLFTVPGTCIPAETLQQISDLGATRITLLGGVRTLSEAVESLARCETPQ